MNQPYVKQFKTETVTENGIEYTYTYDEVLNPITKDKPYIHSFASVRGKSEKEYIIIRHHFTGEFLGRMRMYGNNRANTSKRKNVNSRTFYK